MNFHTVKKLLFCMVISVSLFGLPVFGLEVSEEESRFRITTEQFELRLAKTGVIEDVKPAAAPRFINTSLFLTAEDCGEQDEFHVRVYARGPVIARQSEADDVRYEIIEHTSESFVVTFQWEDRLLKAFQKVSFREGVPYIEMSYTIESKMRLSQVYVQMSSNDFRRDTLFYPDEKRYGSNVGWEFHSLVPGYIFAQDPRLESGLGFIVDDASDLRSFGYLQRGREEGFGGLNYLSMGVYSRALRWDDAGEEIEFSLRMVVGGAEEAAAAARGSIPSGPAVSVEKVRASKLIYWPDEEGEGIVRLKNNSDEQQDLDLRVYIEGGIDNREEILRERISLRAGEISDIAVRWDNADREYGYELGAEVLMGGEAVCAGREYFSVAEQFSKVGHIMVLTPGWISREGQETYIVPHMRDNYMGIIEYYCWMPDQIFNLTPETEVFSPHTESQGSYTATITRKFVKDLVELAHEEGLRVVTLQSGFASLPSAFKYPELMKYTEDGQIYLWGGALHGRDRYAVAPANIYTEEATRDYAREMVASVDMFGWDGVRFDWGFIPIVPSDPLDMEDVSVMSLDEGLGMWYDYEGNYAHDLFPDPDGLAASLLKQWRKEVTSAYPRFEYIANYSATSDVFRRFPEYSKQASTDSGVLLEHLLDFTREEYKTWDKWSNALVASTQRVRKHGGQPSVGWMRGYALGGVTHQLLHHIVNAAGVHWFGHAGPRYSIDDTYKRFRHGMRFSEYFNDPGFRSMPAGQVRVEGSERVLWEPFVYERLRGDARDVTVHLINLPESDYISMHHEVPGVKEELKVYIKLEADEQCEVVNMLLPGPYPHVTRLNHRAEGGYLITEVPELKNSAVVVAEIGGRR